MSAQPANALPSGIVTFLFTDIEGSTRLLGELGDAYASVLDRHHALLRGVWQEFGGHEIDAVGDSFLVVFADAEAAVEAATVAQQAIAGTHWPMAKPLRVRMGVHTGFARPRDGKYVAMAVHQTARVINAAHGGQILLTEFTREHLSPALGGSLEALGRFRVRDFDESQPLFRVIAEGWVDHQRPPRVQPAETHNLVRPLSALIGRDEDLGVLKGSVRPGTLTSVLGPGGIGKTRLATELGLTVSQDWPDGVWMVSLEALRSPDRIPELLAEAVAAPISDSGAVLSEVLEFLAERETLLILDNCEHLVNGVAELVTTLRQRCGRVGALTTTQVPLGVRSEQIFRLRPLATSTSEQAKESPAVQLFVQRAFNLAPAEIQAAAELCRRLDGIPLAIELAAARASSIPPSVILTQLESRMDVLTINDPGLPERHRSIENVLDWSIGLLSDDERAVLQCLAVFAGDFGLQSAQAVADSPERDSAAVAAHVWSLVERSLVWPDETTGGSRFRLPVSVKMTAWQRFDLDQQQAIIKRAGTHFLDAFPPTDCYKIQWNRQFIGEMANVRGVIGDLVGVDEEIGQALAWSLIAYQNTHSAKALGAVEGLQLLEEYRLETPVRVGLQEAVIACLDDSGRAEDAQALLDQAVALLARVGPPKDFPSVLKSNWAIVRLRQGDTSSSQALLKEGLALARTPYESVRLTNTQGLVQAASGRMDDAIATFEKTVAFCREAGDEVSVGIALGNLAEIALRLGRFSDAARWQHEALELGRSQDVPQVLANSLFIAARLLDGSSYADRVVTYNTAGARINAEMGMQLYADDQEATDQSSRRARERLGEDAFARAVAIGESWSRTEAADKVADDLLRIANAGREAVVDGIAN